MKPLQALLILRQLLVIKPNVGLEDLAAIVEAWNVIAKIIEDMSKPADK